MSLSESDYIDVANLTRLRIASRVLVSVVPHGIVNKDLLDTALRITSRLVVYLESRTGDDEGCGEWPEGPCLNPVEVPCSAQKWHDGNCS